MLHFGFTEIAEPRRPERFAGPKSRGEIESCGYLGKFGNLKKLLPAGPGSGWQRNPHPHLVLD
jgi:hypothetical protein